MIISEVVIISKLKSIKSQLFETKQTLIYREQDISYLNKNSKEIIETILSYLQIDDLKLNNLGLVKLDSMSISGDCGNSKELEKIIDSDKIIFRFFQSSCTSCITKELDKLYLLSREIGSNKIVLLTDYLNKDIRWYLIENKINFEVYQTRNASLGLEFEKYQIPYIFICSPNLKIKLPFVLSSKSSEYSDHFYKSIVKKLM